jgi:hypothetical protein
VYVSRRAETKRDPFLCQKSDFGFHPARTVCASPLWSASEPEFDPARVEFGAHRETEIVDYDRTPILIAAETVDSRLTTKSRGRRKRRSREPR